MLLEYNLPIGGCLVNMITPGLNTFLQAAPKNWNESENSKNGWTQPMWVNLNSPMEKSWVYSCARWRHAVR